MDRRAFIRTATSGLLAVPFATLAKNDVPVQVGWVAVAPIRSNIPVFREAMRQRGYKEGENYRVEERYARANGWNGSLCDSR